MLQSAGVKMISSNSFKIISLILCSVFTIGCEYRVSNNERISAPNNIKNEKGIKNKFINDANFIFGNNLIEEEYYATYNANRLIFQLKVDGLSNQEYLDTIKIKMQNKGWKFLNKYKDAYIYCDSKLNQLEIVPPLDIKYSFNLGEGQTLKQLPDLWNISFINSIHKRYVCNKNS
ncbi:hypothetical protein [Acinetobacter shaoyimingii]|uniref:Uncharacterized protein n=1 Tax=Acinetobacter shaoyimingii TaxID=2715164 RepID=A0A6G8RVH9_9GAMM|nr:hypothetical protein [Acinetobacter shaoyimingii]QIO05881.1 hypothetical protein G8E00_07900 [Acinetobacter shaoyimingii]